MDSTRIWASFAIVLLGIWLLATPATFHFQSPLMIGNDLVCGVFLIFLGFQNRKQKNNSVSWSIAIIGIWLQFAPLVFWAKEPASYLNNTLVGTLVILFSVVLSEQFGREKASIPPGWSYNPSSWPQRMPIAFFAFICWMISRYLAAFQLGYIDSAWDPFFSTESVLTSKVSKSFPISDAGLGAFSYTLEFLATCLGGQSRWHTSPWIVFLFGILVIPTGFVSVVLIILQPLAVGAWCSLCLITAICMLIPIPLALGEVVASIRYLKRSKGKLSLFFKGGPCPDAKEDTLTPPLTSSLSSLVKASLPGTTFHLKLLLSAAIGAILMILPWPFHIHGILEDLDPILGAFTIVFSVISFSDLAYRLRWINLLFATVLFIVSLFADLVFSLMAIHLICAIALAWLCKASKKRSISSNVL